MDALKTVTPDHVNELKIVIREIIRAELKHIFNRGNLLGGGDVENVILSSLSSISKVHEENALGNKVDEALGKSLDIYRKVNQIEEELMVRIAKKVVENALGAAVKAVPSSYINL